MLLAKLDRDHSRIYSLSGERTYGNRGGMRYFKPVGWARFAIRAKKKLLQDWPVAYHGTTVVKAVRIMAEGLQQPAGWQDVAHGQAFSTSKTSLYVSPSIEYAAHPVYAELAEATEGTWLQAVLQLRVRPGSFTERPSTLNSSHWPRDLRFDANFESNSNLEWLMEDPTNAVVVGVMVRELGRRADPLVFGEVAARVTNREPGPEYEYTRLRVEEFRRQGLFVVPSVH